ncbi:DUF4157 domain-containing protein [Streptomyces shenzhenensis]|uniref:eCIS core domain-containing protein n=1 Tax=Streptomyces shenzhenensis TaxID=943815 RepID=A0A3M0I430_9ACTN|nr:DUF4157 domain-containing protein [Streptomyces shenzhenensis]RMB80839.1 hypothetical protein CTZ28_38135 [Streptomyces shenzhenensis]
MTSLSQDARAQDAAEQRRRRRKERAAASRAPEPKNIVSGAGQPLDPGVRRELEEQLGHDLSRVRLHTGRDAGQLTELLGADAVAVGQDILFREGAFKPGTDEGRRLLAHELLHTVQNPHGLGALRAGREPGAVSLPQQAIEREAESAARELVRPERTESAPEVREGQATPGWLRYATVDADRRRTEAIDPATLVDRLANSVVRSLRGDPEDLSQRTRKQLARLPGELLDGVLARLERRLLAAEQDRVLDLVDEIEAYDDYAADGLERASHESPGIEPDTAQDVRTERETRARTAEERRAEEDRLGPAPGPEKEQAAAEGATGSTPRNGGTPEQGTTPQGGGAPRGAGRQAPGARGPGSPGGPAAGSGGAASRAESGGGRPQGERESGGSSSQPQGSAGSAGSAGSQGQEKEQGGRERTESQDAAGASKEESAAKNRPGAADAAVAGRQLKQADERGQRKPAGSPSAPGRDAQLPGRFSTLDGRRAQDLDGPEEETDEEPFGPDSESEADAGGGEPSAWDVGLQPDDFVPQQDLDVSAVPTADRLDPSAPADRAVPSFPAPPPTRAEQVTAAREAEDAEDAAAETEPEEDTAAPEPTAPEPAAGTEGGPARATSLDGMGHEQAAAPRAAATRDPKNGDDPKAGPVTAQTTVQEAPGNTGGTSEADSREKASAAKEEQGTRAAGDQASAAPEKESQQATGGRAAQSDTGAQETAGATGYGASAADAREVPSGGTVASTAPSGSGSAPAAGVHGGATDAAGPQTAREPSAPAEPNGCATAPAPRPASAAAEPAVTPRAESGAKAAPETAPEPAPAAPTPRSPRGGGGAPAPARGKKGAAPAPNLSGVSPEAGLATASKLKPHTALQAMGGVGGAVDRSVGDEHRTLAAAPPAMQRPAGAPQTLRGEPRTDAPARYAQDPAEEAQAPEAEDAKVTGEQQPEGQIEAEQAEEPGGWDTFKMALGFGLGKVASWLGFEVDPQELAAKFAGLPTKDEALEQARAGDAPGVEMRGAADRTAGEQDGHVDAKGQETVATARDDAGRGMGEDQVYPDAPKEQLTAQVPGQQGGQQGVVESGGATGAVPPEAASEVAEHERGPQFQAAFSDGRQSMSEGRQTKDRDFRNAQDKHKQQVDAEIAANTATQAGERDKAMAEVTAQREDWRTEQDDELNDLGDKKTERHDRIRTDVEDEQQKTDDNVEKEKGDSDKKIQDESDRAERDAEQQRDGAVQDSGNWVTKAFDWIKQKVIEIKNAIVRVIRAARDAVIGFIRTFKETVERWINDARKNIVEAIKNFIKDLIEFARAMVRAVIELADRIRKFITSLIEAAIALVNRLAQALKQAVTDLLNAIGKLLSGILDLLKKMLQAAVKAVVAAVRAVLEFASKLLGALGAWMLIAVDFLSDPGGWLGGAKNSAVDGAKNHLFREVSAAVKQWFQEKIQEIIGVPKAVIDQLVKGGFTLERIVKEAWDAVVPQLPLIIGELVITKVVAKLIPGAGWVMAVIDAIRTAWGALSAILASLGAVLGWLRAVRMGGAGILFAKAVAAGAVALLEVLYQALLNGIGKYVAKVGRRLKGVAARLAGRGGPGPRSGGADGAGGRPRSDERGGPRAGAASAATPKTPAGPRPGTDRPGPPGPASGRPPAGPGRPARPRPEPIRPAAPATTRPRPERDTPSRPNRPRDEADSSRPRDDRAPGRPAENDRPPSPRRPRQQDAPPRPRPDKDGTETPRKPQHTKDDERDPRKPKHDKDGAGRPKKPKHTKDDRTTQPKKDPHKEKQEKKNHRKKEEDSKESKDARLSKIVARIRPKLHGMLSKGVKGPVHKAALGSMRMWYRLTSLAVQGTETFRDEAVLNPRQLVINGREMASEPILRYVRELERLILSRAEQPGQVTGSELNGRTDKGPSGSDRRHLDIPSNLDIGRVIALLKRERTLTQIWNWGTAQIHRTKLGGWYLRKFRNGQTLPEVGEGTTTYADIAKRILAAGAEGEASAALASTPDAGRTLGPSVIADDIALHNSLSYVVERDRNPGNMVMSAMQADLFARARGMSDDARKKWFRNVFGMNTMSPQGAPKGGALLKRRKYLKDVGVIEKEIAEQTRKAANRGVDQSVLSDPRRIRAEIERQIEEEIADLPAEDQNDKKEQRKARNRVEKRNRDLVKLESLHQGNLLAEREIRLIEEWVKMQARDLDVSDPVTEEELREQLKAKIRARFEQRFPYIRGSS